MRGKPLVFLLQEITAMLHDIMQGKIDEANVEGVATGIYLSNDEQVEAFEMVLPDEGKALFEAMRAVYSSYVLPKIFSCKLDFDDAVSPNIATTSSTAF